MSIRWQLPLTYALIALIAAVTSGTVLIGVLQNYYTDRERDYLEKNVDALQSIAEGIWRQDMPSEMRGIRLAVAAESIAFFAQTRIMVSDTDGTMVVDTGAPREYIITMANIGSQQIIEGTTPFDNIIDGGSEGENPLSFDVRPMETTDVTENDLNYTLPIVSSPFGFQLGTSPSPHVERRSPPPRSGERVEADLLNSDEQRIGRVSISDGPAIGQEILEQVIQGWLIAGFNAVLIAGVIGWFISRRLTRPLTTLTLTTETMSAGDLSARANINRRDELGTLAESFNTMAGRIETTVNTLRRFVADAAHEIHTPITATRTNLELLRETNDTPNVRAALAQIDQLQALANDLLDLSRVEAGDKMEKSAVNVVTLVENLSEVYASRAEQADLDYELELPAQPVILHADKRQLERMIANLLDNAIKFTPAGGVVRVAVKLEAGRVTLTVQDSGIGIPEQDLPYLFERFKRGRNVPHFAGSGLGLAIVKAISDAHGGQVHAHSADGTTMTVSLPLSA